MNKYSQTDEKIHRNSCSSLISDLVWLLLCLRQKWTTHCSVVCRLVLVFGGCCREDFSVWLVDYDWFENWISIKIELNGDVDVAFS